MHQDFVFGENASKLCPRGERWNISEEPKQSQAALELSIWDYGEQDDGE